MSDAPLPAHRDPANSGHERIRRWMASPNPGGFQQRLGARPVEIGEGWVRLSCEIGADHANLSGILHGGVAATLVDMAGGAAAMTLIAPGEIVLTSDLSIRYLAPAGLSDGPILAEGRVTQRAGRKMIAQVEVTTGEGKLIAQGSIGAAVRPAG